MTCSSCRLTWGCPSSVRPAEEVYYRPDFPVGHDHAVVLVAGTGWGWDAYGGGRAGVAARWAMACGYV